ncbi:MAG: hypothetical protein IPL03_03450 [Sterolibacteriaceae bacterium]|nr:hypothetical protein [Candidatus Methylophosphatis haderslevensis]
MSLDNIKPLKAAKRSFVIRFLKRCTKDDYERRLAKTKFQLSRLPMDDKAQMKWETEIAEIKKFTNDAEAAIAAVKEKVDDLDSMLAKPMKLAERTKYEADRAEMLKEQEAAEAGLPAKYKEAYQRLDRIKKGVRQAADAFSKGEGDDVLISKRIYDFGNLLRPYGPMARAALATLEGIDETVTRQINEIGELPLPPLDVSEEDALQVLEAKQAECASDLRKAEEAGRVLRWFLKENGDPERVMLGLNKRITVLNATRPKAMYELRGTRDELGDARDPQGYLDSMWRNLGPNFQRSNGEFVTQAYVEKWLGNLPKIESRLAQAIERQQRRWVLPPLPPIPLDEPPARKPPSPPEESLPNEESPLANSDAATT